MTKVNKIFSKEIKFFSKVSKDLKIFLKQIFLKRNLLKRNLLERNLLERNLCKRNSLKRNLHDRNFLERNPLNRNLLNINLLERNLLTEILLTAIFTTELFLTFWYSHLSNKREVRFIDFIFFPPSMLIDFLDFFHPPLLVYNSFYLVFSKKYHPSLYSNLLVY